MKKILLTEEEFIYCHKAGFILAINTNIFSSACKVLQGWLIDIMDEDADEIRDFLGEKLQVVGFDKNYNLTEEGKTLEALIDKFFIG